MLHSAELHVLQASTLTNDGVAKGARGRGGGREGRKREGEERRGRRGGGGGVPPPPPPPPEGQTARPGTENSPKFTRPVAPPSSPFNL